MRKVAELAGAAFVLLWLPAAVVMLVTSIWTGDERWAITAVVMILIFAAGVYAVIRYTRTLEPKEHGKRSLLKNPEERS